MATVENLPSPSTERPIGFGRLKRKEDARFIRGQGTYLDDIRLPGMVHGAILRSPYAHARIVSIDTSRALAHPNVAAVVTAKDLETLGLAWMPTISYDTQAVLAGDKVRFQGQEVAFVIATDEYSANDALQLIDVEYEPLPAIVNARKALDPDAPLIRDDKAGQRDNLASPTWEAGDEEATDRAFAEADTVVSRDMIYPRCHPAPLETCGMIADFNPETGQLDIYNGNQAPHAHRTVYAHVAGLAEHMIRIRCQDIGGGFGNKVPIYPGYVCAIVGSLLLGKPVKWMEDRSENLTSTGFARDYIMVGEIAATKEGKILAIRSNSFFQIGAYLVGRLEVRPAPEAVGDSGRDDQCVIPLGRRRAVVMADTYGAGGKVESRQSAMDGAHPVQAAEPVERDPVGARPVLRARQPPAQFLAADQCRFGRDSDHLGVAGEPDRGEYTAVTQPRDDDALAIHTGLLERRTVTRSNTKEGHPITGAPLCRDSLVSGSGGRWCRRAARSPEAGCRRSSRGG